jgi:hypothetical protein
MMPIDCENILVPLDGSRLPSVWANGSLGFAPFNRWEDTRDPRPGARERQGNTGIPGYYS